MYPVISLLFVFAVPISSYNITKLEPGIMFEKLQTIHIQSSTWTFISHINLTTHKEEIEYVTDLINNTKQQCSLLITSNNRNHLCDAILVQLEKDLYDITTQDEYILTQSQDKNRKRKTRGLINVIGYGMKALFGTMTESDAEKYMAEIRNLEKSANNMEHRVDTHTTILKNALKTLNESSIGLNRHSELLNELNESFFKLRNSYTIDSIYTHTHFKFEELSEYIILALAKIRRDQAKLFEIIFAAKKGVLHETLFDPQSIFEELVSAQLTLHGQHFVYPIQKSNTYKILSLSDFSAILAEDILLFEINTPLIRGEMFKIYNTIPIPQHVSENTFTVIIPEFKTFLISKNHEHYASFLDPDRRLAEECKEIQNDHFLCNQKYPLFITHSRRNCEVEIFNTASVDYTICTTTQYELTEEIWIPLRELNSYVFIAPKPTHITMNCNDVLQSEQIVNPVLIHTTCDIKTSSVSISGFQHYQSNYSTNTQHIVRLPSINVSDTQTITTLRPHDKMKPIEPLLDQQFDNAKEEDIDHKTIIFTATAIIIIFAIILLYIFAVWLYIGGVKSRNNARTEVTE